MTLKELNKSGLVSVIPDNFELETKRQLVPFPEPVFSRGENQSARETVFDKQKIDAINRELRSLL